MGGGGSICNFSLISSFAWNSSLVLLGGGEKHFSAISSLATISPHFAPPPLKAGLGRLGNIRLKMEEFARQVGGESICKNMWGGGSICNFPYPKSQHSLAKKRQIGKGA